MLKRILIDLDALLDTRLGTIQRICPEAAVDLVKTRDYWTRENDFWDVLTKGRITNEQFAEAYAERGGQNTADTLNASVMTGIMPFLMRVLAEDNVNRMDNMGNPLDEVCVCVNIHPYDLDGEYKEQLVEIIKELYGQSTTVEIVKHSMEELSPFFMDALFAMYITYDFIPWVKYHAEELGKVKMNCFNFIGPKIFEHDVSNINVEAKKYTLWRFRMEKLIHMDFEFIDAMYFSMFRA
ncbi:hypothetical protein AVT69_gp168 [Pseudomonas phage PhiPA3]|uniref:Uncharacterized protein 170 n=1 Tax=Pseudomonas phage PhiPA3 TaxID=998086 RepID=F8SK43_BPPA3|nr:hypothetical protein AVT69_gp168 [Pseudomonas phage PhiPA3]AEH03593.1 hypothetical protein [Pseudomonas phage PhiPA3]